MLCARAVAQPARVLVVVGQLGAESAAYSLFRFLLSPALPAPWFVAHQERTAPTKRPNGERNFGGQGGTCHHCRRSSGNTRGCILTCGTCQCSRRLKKPAYFHEGCLRLFYGRQLVRGTHLHAVRALHSARKWVEEAPTNFERNPMQL